MSTSVCHGWLVVACQPWAKAYLPISSASVLVAAGQDARKICGCSREAAAASAGVLGSVFVLDPA